jgi:hypothetical protein
MKNILTAFALALLCLGVASDSAQTQDYSVSIVNAASQQSGDLGGVARGSLVTIYVQPPITAETLNFNPWVEQTPTGAWIEMEHCTVNPATSKKLRILFVGAFGSGPAAYNQFSVYIPNDIGPEPFGACQQTLPQGYLSKYVFHPAPGFGGEFFKLAGHIPQLPGVFAANGTGTGAPHGFHLNAVTGAATTISNCNTTPGACPVSTNGVPNYLILYLTGGEVLSCNEGGGKKCSDPINFFDVPHFRLSGAEQPLLYYGYAGFLGQEQANLQIKPGTAPGDYTLTVTAGGGCVVCPMRSLPVSLGAAN